MADHIILGQKGEALAVTFLAEKGYDILETNWRYKRAEVDIIAKDGNVLVFTEVKTRATDYFGAPEESITSKKKALLTDAASAYMELINHDWEIRFDYISVIYEDAGNFRLKHFKDAFFPGLF